MFAFTRLSPGGHEPGTPVGAVHRETGFGGSRGRARRTRGMGEAITATPRARPPPEFTAGNAIPLLVESDPRLPAQT